MALIMICIASISVFVNQKLIGSRKSYATIGGKGGRSTPLRLGKHKPLITACCSCSSFSASSCRSHC